MTLPRSSGVAYEAHAAIFDFMSFELGVRIGIVLSLAMVVSSPARGQVLVETGVISKKAKDLGEMIGKAAKQPANPQPRVVSPSPGSRASARTAKPSVLPDTFSPDLEDPASVLGIDADVMTRFSSALAAEVAKRGERQNQLTRASYDAIGAKAGAFTPRQYLVLKARVLPFCEAVTAGQPYPNDLRFSYMPTEAAAISPHCIALLPELKGILGK